MEDLGNINITIRESRSGGGGGPGMGGGGSGSAGGGPGAVPPPPTSPAQQASAQAAGWRDRLSAILGGASQMGGLARSPSVSGFLEASASGSAVSQGLGAIAPSLASLTPIAAGVGLAFGLATKAVDFLRGAAEKTAQRISEVGRYSSEISNAMAMENIRRFQRNIREAAVNADVYSRAQRSATASADAWSGVETDLNRGMAGLSAIFQFLSRRAAAIIARPAAAFAGTALSTQDAVDDLESGWERFSKGMHATLDYFVKTNYQQFGTGFWGQLAATAIELLREIAMWCGITVENTKPKPPMGRPNDWFMDDIRAMTGRPY